MPGSTIRIGSLVLDRRALELFENGNRLLLGTKACRILIALAERHGEIVSPAELTEAAWPDQHVEEVNLRVQIGAIRKVLAECSAHAPTIKTVPREGYLLILPEESADTETPERRPARYAPRLLEPLIGRTDAMAHLAQLLATRRIVTIKGAAGIGKTSLALAAAAQWAGAGREWVFVDLAVPINSAQVAQKVHAALELTGKPQDLVSDIVRALRSEEILIVLDNCEHVLDGAAAISQALGQKTDGVRILATSRESLATYGEHVFQLDPLDCGPVGRRLKASEALAYPGIELFANRAKARGQSLMVHDGNVSQIAEICQRLDGIPLAIQLAASSCEVMTVGELARRLDDRFSLLTHGERTALPRHKTLQAALEWGHDLLQPAEATVFRRLGVFRHAFAAADVHEVATGGDLARLQVDEAIKALTAKSFMVVEGASGRTMFRFLETTRIFALAKLGEVSELTAVVERHARNVLGRFASIGGLPASSHTKAIFRSLVDDWRGAHDHALETAQGPLALDLLHRALTMCERLNITDEFVDRSEKTFDLIDQTGDRSLVSKELAVRNHYSQILAIYGSTRDLESLSKMTASAKKALDLARTIDAVPEQLQALWALANSASGRSDTQKQLFFANEFRAVADRLGDPQMLQNAYRLQCAGRYWSGDFAGAVAAVNEALRDPGQFMATVSTRGDGHASTTLTMYARAKWAIGEFDEAIAQATRARLLAHEAGDARTLYYVLYTSVLPISLWSGNMAEAVEHITTIEELARQYSAAGWGKHMKQWHIAINLLQQCGGSYGSAAVAAPFGAEWFADNATSLHCAFHKPQDLVRVSDRVDHWCTAEHYRAAGEQVLAGAYPDLPAVRLLFDAALDIAERQGAIAWQIRARNSIARLCLAADDRDGAAAVLAPVRSRFSADSVNADVRMAWSLL
jgi:predicted ATPase